jgi:hypothetical protein
VQSIIETGELLLRAKRLLPHGEFEAMVKRDLPFAPGTAQRLMAIASDERLTNPAHAPLLPPAWTALYELTKLDDATFYAKISSGEITPDMKRGQIRAPSGATASETGAGNAIDVRGRLPGADRKESGYWIDEGHVRHTITWPGETYHTLLARADTNDVSFNEEVLTLIEWALEAYDRWETEAGEA